MASKHLIGDARIVWTPPGMNPETFLLGAPLHELEPIDVRPRYEWWSEDGTSREIVTIGGGVRDILATIRFDDQPGGLKRLLRHGLEDDVNLNYQRVSEGTVYPVKLVAIVGAQPGTVPIQRDRDRRGLAEYEVRVHLRRVDGGSLDGMLVAS